jgi:tRNA 2-thiouridine synthesizing protein A
MSKLPIPSDAKAKDGAKAEDGQALDTAVVVDARGHHCPTPTLRLRRALETAAPDDCVVLLADDPLARIDVPHFLASEGYAPAVIVEIDGGLRIMVRKRRDEGSFGKVFTAIP